MPPSAHLPLSTALLSDTGRVRSNNEDAVAEDPALGLLVLADGMGGYNAGEVASGMAVATILEALRRLWQPSIATDGAISGFSPQALWLRQAVEQAHAAIYSAARSQPQYAGMGTTVVALLLHGHRMSVAHVGDSRLYRQRADQLVQLTRDHSLQEELIAKGHYTREQALSMVSKNIVTRALGVEPTVNVELTEETVQAGDILLLCSDGLTDMVADEQIGISLRGGGGNLASVAQDLVQQALRAGGRDNVSVVLARVEAPPASRPWHRRWRWRDWF